MLLKVNAVKRWDSTGSEFVEMLEKREAGFDETTYYAKLAHIMRNYTTKDMVRYSEINCKIRRKQS